MLTREITKILYDIHFSSSQVELRIEKVKNLQEEHYDVRFKCDNTFQHFVYTNLDLTQVSKIKEFFLFLENLKEHVIKF